LERKKRKRKEKSGRKGKGGVGVTWGGCFLALREDIGLWHP